jgi:ABC-type branched-subunit amino acid transport system substrate-binding protein
LSVTLKEVRVYIAAVVALLLILGLGALGGADARSVALAQRNEAARASADSDTGAGATSSGIPLADINRSSGAAVSGPTGVATGRTAATGGTRITYDDGADDQVVRIGGSTFTSGPAATYGEQIAVGFAAGINYINEHGGINGRRVVMKIYDDGGDPAKQLANTKRLVEVDHVFALAMSYAAIVGEYVASKGVPVFHLGQFNDEFTNPWWFPVGGPQLTSAMALAWYGAKVIGVKSVSVFYLDVGANNFSSDFADKVASYWKAYGVDVKSKVPFTADQTSCSQGISAASGDNVDFIDFEIDAGHVIQCGVEAQIQGYKPPKSWGGYLIGVPVIHEALGDYSVGMYAFDAFGDEYTNPDYIAAVKRVSPKTETYSSVTISYFVSAMLARDSMSKLGNQFTRAHLRDVLNTFTDWRPGMTPSENQPKWTWRPECHVAIHGGYLIQIHKQPNGSLRWDQSTPQGTGAPLPPGIAPPADFAKCNMFVPGETAKPF